jgi:hypothetical protein
MTITFSIRIQIQIQILVVQEQQHNLQLTVSQLKSSILSKTDSVCALIPSNRRSR